ncbi:hypothetical protein IQ07DRAFT_587605 [Pyrenochaeta sp. DS3sAY3a]|nr:hypothetical protein IQ07DRAFT_587605 [Pyrenochaeta sp. DS3sAY3a]
MAENRYPNLTWQQTSLGRWDREVDEAERFYTLLAKSCEGSGRMFFAITGFVSVSVQTADSITEEVAKRLEEALRSAWLRLRYDYPTIASQVKYDEHEKVWKKLYTPFYEDDVEVQTKEWLGKTFVPINPGVSGLDWCNSDPPAPKVPTLFVITPTDTKSLEDNVLRRDLVIRSPHDTMDGIGTLQLLNNLLAHAAQAYENPGAWKPPPPGSEFRNLSPPIRVAASIPPILSLKLQQDLQDLIAGNAALRQEVDVLSVPFKSGPTVPGKHQRIALEIPASDTARLLSASKSLGATITHIYHAAIAIAVRDFQKAGPRARTGRYITYSLINERPKCNGDYSTSKHAAAVYHSVSGNHLAIDLTIPSDTDEAMNEEQAREEFRAVVQQMKSYYHSIRDSPDNLALSPSFWSMGTPHVPDPTSTNIPIPPPNNTPSVSISSMGVVDKIIRPQHGALKADNPWVTGEELGTGLGLFLGTWKGNLNLSAAYNDAWHDKETVEEFVKHCQDVVWKGLALNEE